MIVLDEQLLGYGLQLSIPRWYRGRVIDITQLRPATRILDDAVPALVRTVRQATFVTINVSDFWRRLAPDKRMAIACFDLPHQRARDISRLLRRLLGLPGFRTRRERMGKIVRVSPDKVQFYTTDSWAVQTLNWPRKKRRAHRRSVSDPE